MEQGVFLDLGGWSTGLVRFNVQREYPPLQSSQYQYCRFSPYLKIVSNILDGNLQMACLQSKRKHNALYQVSET